MNSSVISLQTTPLCCLPNGQLVCYRYGKIIAFRDSKESIAASIGTNANERYFGWSKYAIRLMRFGVRTAIALDDEHIIISIGNIIICKCGNKFFQFLRYIIR